MLDLSKFKKVKSDEKHTVVKHPNGHEIKIAHKGLAPEHLKELKSMPMHKYADGGSISEQSQIKSYQNSTPSTTPKQAADEKEAQERKQVNEYPEKLGQGYSPMQSSPQKEEYAKGGRVKMAEGGNNPSSDDSRQPASDSSNSQQPTINLNFNGPPGSVLNQGQMAPVTGIAGNGIPNALQKFPDQSQQIQQPQNNSNPAQSAPTPMDNSSPTPNPAPSQQIQTAPIPTPQEQQVNANPMATPQDQTQVSPEVTQANASTPEQISYEYQQNAQENAAAFAQQNRAWLQDQANGHITPMTYADLYAKKDTMGKIGMVLGTILGGIGGGLTHTKNAAIEAMDNIIDRDLKAQVASKENARNWITISNEMGLKQAQSKYYEAQTQKQQAETAAYPQKTQAEIAKTGAETKEITGKTALDKASTDKIALETAKSKMWVNSIGAAMDSYSKMPPGPAKDRFGMGLASITPEIMQKADSPAMLIGQIQAMGNMSSKYGDSADMLVKPLAPVIQDYRSRTLPNVSGKSEVPLTEEFRNQDADYQYLHQLLGQTKQFINKVGLLGPNLDLSRAQPGEANALESQLTGALQRIGGYNGGRLNETTLDLSKRLANLGSTQLTSQDMSAINKMDTLLQTERNTKLKSRGKNLGGEGGESSESGSSGSGRGTGPQEGQEMPSQSGKPMIYKNGQWRYK
jgi:hypothetical protein